MRIAYCLHSLHRAGGIERVLTIKANYLAERSGHEVHIIAACLKGRTPAFELSDRIMVHDLGTNDNIPWSGYASKLGSVLAGIDPDISIAIGDNSMKALLRSRDRSAKIAEFHFSHEKFMMKYNGNPLAGWYAAYRTRALERLAAGFDRFVVLTASDCRDWQETLSNVTFIGNPQTFTSPDAASLTGRHCMAAGRLEKQKNFKDAVTAWQAVARKHPDWTLDIYGTGSLEKELRKQIGELSLDGKVRLMGLSRDVRHDMLESSMLVMTSVFEGFPMVLLEAAETGLPVVSYDCPKGPSDIVEDGKTGFLVKPGDTAALSNAICRLIEDESMRKDFGKAAREKSGEYSMDRTMERWNTLFRELAGS